MRIAFVLLVIGVAAAVFVAIACPVDFPRAVFVYARHPDFPRTEFASGNLGVIQPSYAVSYLVVAYRYLSGHGLSAVEREQVYDYWKDRGTGSWDRIETDWSERWDGARIRVPGARELPLAPVTQGKFAFDQDSNSFVVNCAEDAYRVAYRTLEGRIRQFGLRSVAVREWRDAQDQVFLNCGRVNKEIPVVAAASLPILIRQDRDYQIAAAQFYSARYKEAEAGFRRIAFDSQSPWQMISRYLVARTLSREGSGTFTNGPGLANAESEARAILADPKLTEIHGMTRVLLHRMILKDGDEEYLHELGRDLAGGRAGRSWREEMWVYTTLYDRWGGQGNPYLNPPQPPPDHNLLSRDELSDWVHAFSDDDAIARSRSLSQWKRTHAVPWLIAALRHASGKQPDADALIEAAAAIPGTSPGFATASYHRLRLLMEMGRPGEVREAADRMLGLKLAGSTANAIRSLRMMAAPTMAEFFTFAARRPVRIVWRLDLAEANISDDAPPHGKAQGKDLPRNTRKTAAPFALLDRDSIKVLNERTPLRVLAEAALSDRVPPYHERDFTLVAFTRAVLLNDFEWGVRLAAKLRGLGADQKSYLAGYESATGDAEREFAAVFYLLHHTEARPYFASGLGRMSANGEIAESGDNWWCPIDIAVELDSRVNIPKNDETWEYRRREDPDAPTWRAAFLTAADREAARQETARIAKTQAAPDYFFRVLRSFGQAHRDDPRLPEAYNLALLAHRWGCTRAETQDAALEAWRTLWRYYPRSPWTKKAMVTTPSENVPLPAPK